MKHTIFTSLAVAVVLLTAFSLGRDTPVRQAENASPVASEEASIHAFGDSDKTCQEWSDGCRTCRRPDAGEAFCSNMPIACQPTAITCARRTEPPK